MPLGVFGLLAEGQTKPDQMLQLEVSKSGQIRGTYRDAVAGTELPISGSVNKASQRAAWQVSGSATVMEAGISSFTGEEEPLLLHYGKDRTQSRMMVRLKKPSEG